MVTKEQLEAAIETNTYTPLDRGILVLAPKIEKYRTIGDKQILKSESEIAEEASRTDSKLKVVAVHPQCINVSPKDSVIPKSAITELYMIECPIPGFTYAQIGEHNLVGVIRNIEE